MSLKTLKNLKKIRGTQIYRNILTNRETASCLRGSRKFHKPKILWEYTLADRRRLTKRQIDRQWLIYRKKSDLIYFFYFRSKETKLRILVTKCSRNLNFVELSHKMVRGVNESKCGVAALSVHNDTHYGPIHVTPNTDTALSSLIFQW
jgi:hypothetical protein